VTPADLTLSCPRCGVDCPAWIVSRDYRRDTVKARVWCEAHGAKWVTL
jgi:hypothetical protein